MADALGTAGGVVSAQDHRLTLAGLYATHGATALDVRTGVIYANGATALLSGTAATGTMTVSILPHHWVTSRGAADGVYSGMLEASTTVNIAAAPGANSRIDVVYVKQQDAGSSISPDGTTAPLYGVVTGTAAASPTKPAIPVGAIELGTVTVATGATSTNGAGVTIGNTARITTGRGAPIPVRNQTERDALSKYPGLQAYRIDSGDIEMVNTAGTGWVTVFDQVVTPGAWTTLSMAAGFAAYTPVPQYRQESDRVFLRGWAFVSTVVGAGAMTSVAVPASLRPTAIRGLFMPWENSAGTSNGVVRMEMRTDGLIYTMRGVGANTYVNLDGLSYAIS